MSNKNKGCLFAIIEIIIGLFKPQKKESTPEFRRKFLLTKNELNFYKELKKVADELNLTILSKIRMADLVEPLNKDYKGFAKVRAKHIDFALCNPENLYVMLLIELDDNSHNRADRAERDKFVNEVYAKTGYKLLRVNNSQNLKQSIINMLQVDDNKITQQPKTV